VPLTPAHDPPPPSGRGAHGSTVDALLPLAYRELRRIARAHRRHRSAGETLCTTALVHEAWLKLVRNRDTPFADRRHFLAVASRAMRQVIVDYARRRVAEKRGGGAFRLPLDALTGTPQEPDPERQAVALLALDAALDRLDRLDPRLARVVELRFFAELPVQEVARILDVSTATVKRDTRLARAFLGRELLDPRAPDGDPRAH